MQDFLAKAYYGNTILEWLIALAIIVGALLLAKAVYWVLSNVVRRMTSKTETKLDDIVMDMFEEPVVFAIIVSGIWYGINTLNMPETLSVWIGNVAQVLVVLAITWLLARVFDALSREYVVPVAAKTETDLDDQLLPLFRKAVKVTIWALGIIIALNNAGYDVAALLAGLGIGGLALAMAARDTVSNIFGGFTIFSDRPFSIGDPIKITGHDGTVTEIGIRSTRLQTLEGRVVSIPNSKFSDGTVENISMEPSRKVVSNLGLTYDTTPGKMREAMRTLKQIVKENQNLEDGVFQPVR